MDTFDLQEQAYEKFCNGELTQPELRAELENMSLIGLTEYLTTKGQQIMENYKATLRGYKEQAQKDAERIQRSYSEFTPVEKRARQQADTAREIQKHSENLKRFVERLQTRQAEIKAEIKAKRYPSLTKPK
jgi:polyhydroxyalkanoate synthesis regulator protein